MARAAFAAGSWAGPQTTHSATIASWSAGDTMLAVCIFVDATITVSSWSMTGESAPSSVGTIARAGSNSSVQWAILSNVTGTGSKTVTATLSGSATGICCVWRLTGRDTTSAYDIQAAVTGTGNATAANALSVTSGSDVFSVVSESGFDNPTAGSGTQDTIPNFNSYEEAAYLENQSGSVDISWSWSGSSAYVASAIAVKAAGGGGGGGNALAWIRA